MIPKTLFQTWKCKEDVPSALAYWSTTFRTVNPGFSFHLWDDAANRTFISEYFSWFLPTYNAYPAEIYRADAVRYFFLYEFGGVYADMDTECLRPLEPLLKLGGVLLARMGTDENFPHSLPNAIMFSEPGQEFWLFVMSLMLEPPTTFTVKRPEHRTGPVMLKSAYDAYTTLYQEPLVQDRISAIRSLMGATNERTRSQITVLPGHLIYPLNWNDLIHKQFFLASHVDKGVLLDRQLALELFPTALTVTYWAHSWEEQLQQA